MGNIFKKIAGRFLFYRHIWGLYTNKGITCCVNHKGTSYKIIANSKIELYNRVRDYATEEVTIDWIDNYIKDGDSVYDVGANIGIYSLLIAKKYPASKVIAFEPEAGNFYKLNKNILLNGLKNVLPFPVGISSCTGISKLYVSSLDLGSSCHSLEQPYSDGVFFIPKNEQGIAAYSLNDFILMPDIPFPDHLKIDVDGFELNVIKGCSSLLKDNRLKSIVVEISHSVNSGVVEEIINKAGFEERKRENWANNNGDVSNILFTR